MQTETTTPAASAPDEKAQILFALGKFIRQRSGIDPRNYISHGMDDAGRKAYRAEARSITRDYQHARALLAAVRMRSISAENLKSAFTRAYSGRLSWNGTELNYCTGQYFPTEYRRAVCAVAATALWAYWRDSYTDARMEGFARVRTAGSFTRGEAMEGARDYVLKQARAEFGRGIASRWFT
jgi:hypothetical protein